METLFEVDKDLQAILGVVQDWTITDDGLTYTFHLTPGVQFHDGAALDAEAVESNFARMMDLEFGSPSHAELEFVSGVTVLDDVSLEVQMAQPFAAFLPALMSWTGMMVSPTAIAETGNEGFENSLIGVGYLNDAVWTSFWPGLAIFITILPSTCSKTACGTYSIRVIDASADSTPALPGCNRAASVSFGALV